MTLHLGLPGAHNRSEKQQQEIREARKWLKEHIHDDWEYPSLPAWESSTSGRKRRENQSDALMSTVAGFRFHASSLQEESTKGQLNFEPIEWREREESSASATDSEIESSSTRITSSTYEKEYKFDGPDSVGTQMMEQRTIRKRKRQKLAVDEMSWNDGLAHWIAQRDKWCSARTREDIEVLKSSKDQKDANEGAENEVATIESTGEVSSSLSTHSSPRTSTSSASATISSSATTPDPGSGGLSAVIPIRNPGPLTSNPTNGNLSSPPASSLPSLPSMIPVAPIILPNHPIRRRMNPDMYPQIYTKVILQSRTPSVPINLQTLVNAMVKGWKDDGEWPPKAGVPEPSLGRRKAGVGSLSGPGGGGGFRSSVKAVGRALGLKSGGPELPK
ncbi:Hypothetical protein R9X50_00709400 [Acrodontium crateriforme]|uniref:Gag1-like clamp domain-containing protein n=1 Tax=Acrodontium crateriforme TaxID=150365 RepID=A0AAQ3MAT8_9PEZI|nr:Hypothetical protein R9X50_00709400 [Acrodontium crateriforme]